MTRAKRSID